MAKKPTHEELEQRVKELEYETLECKRAEEALRENEALLKAAIESTEDGILAVDENGKTIIANLRFRRMWRMPDELFNKKDDEKMLSFVLDQLKEPDDFLSKVQNLYGTTKEDLDLLNFKDGRIFERYSRPMKIGEKLTGRVWSFRDITKRTQSEVALWENEEKYRTILDSIEEAYFEIDIAGNLTFFNDSLSKSLGYSDDELMGMNNRDYMSPDSSKKIYELFNQIYNTGNPIKKVPYEIIRKDGSSGFHELFASLMKNQAGQRIGFRGISHDITDRQRAEEALLESEERYRALFERSLESVYLCDFEGNFIDANDVALELLGYSKDGIKSLNFVSLLDKDQLPLAAETVEEILKTGSQKDVAEYKLRRKDGEHVYVESMGAIIYRDGKPFAIQGIARDITGRKQSEEQKHKLEALLQQSQKMEAVGTLAGGIAHDFNNILAIILGNAELASADVPDWNPASESLKEIRRASIRAKDMVHQLLAFSRKSDEESKPIDIAPIIKESMKMLRSAIPTSVEFKQHISDNSYSVMGDATQINQIVMNLVTNAADAMSEEGGLLEMTLEKIILQEEKACFDWVLSPGPYVRLRTRDTGEGVEPKIMDRIFDPYYTTKEVGKGTGMGLSVIHGIVKRHGGGIRVESKPGKGTLFEIYFPALEKTEEEEKEPEEEIKGGSERILFVDDEEPMVNLYRRHLERLGYDVKSTTKPVEALEWFKADPDQFDVIITDMTMPRMTGDRLAAEVLKIRPNMPVIICTGYSERMSAKKAEALGVRKYIEKPIDLRNLASSLREVLDGQ